MFNSLLERFLRYVQIYSESSSENAENGVMPSTPQQMDFAKSIVSELESMGLCDLQISKNCYVYGYLPASNGLENVEPVCFLAHMDTVEEVSGLNVKPQVHKNYDGAPIALSEKNISIVTENRDIRRTRYALLLLPRNNPQQLQDSFFLFAGNP